MLISPEYQELNKQLHETNESYGVSSARWVDLVIELSSKYNCADILDYGCGKGKLKQGIGPKVKEYDPAIEGKTEKHPCDLVVCTDVMEHIEPDCLDGVLDDLEAMTKKAAFITVATRPAKKILADGRNAHLIVEDSNWWVVKFTQRWKLVTFQDLGGEFLMVLEKRCVAG